jgi:hypothetical protein
MRARGRWGHPHAEDARGRGLFLREPEPDDLGDALLGLVRDRFVQCHCSLFYRARKRVTMRLRVRDVHGVHSVQGMHRSERVAPGRWKRGGCARAA